MEGSKPNYWKVGLFVVAGVTTTIVGVFWIGAQRLNRPKEPRVTYFDESVQGLEVGAPVKMRGVTIGEVSEISIAPDRRLVQVTAEIFEDIWVKIGMGSADDLRSASRELPPDLRMQLSMTGITGVKFLQVDFFPNAEPPPKLTMFEPPYNYIPSTPSTMKSLEEGLTVLSAQLPSTLAAFRELAETVDEKVTELDVQAIVAGLQEAVESADTLLDNANEKLTAIDTAKLSTDLEETVASFNRLLAKLEADDGPLMTAAARLTELIDDAQGFVATAETAVEDSDIPGTIAAYRGFAVEASALPIELERSLAVLRETLVAVQALASYLERHPGALLSGRSPDRPPPTRDDR